MKTGRFFAWFSPLHTMFIVSVFLVAVPAAHAQQCPANDPRVNCAIGGGITTVCKSQCPAQQTNSVSAGESSGSSNTSTSQDQNKTLECDKVNLTGLGGGVVTCWKEGIRGGQEAKACQVKGTTCQSLRDEAVDYMKHKQSAAGEQGFAGGQSGEAEFSSNPLSDVRMEQIFGDAYSKENIGSSPLGQGAASDFNLETDAILEQFAADAANPNSDWSKAVADAEQSLTPKIDWAVRPSDFKVLDAARGIVSPDWLNRASANIVNQSLGAVNPATPFYTPQGDISSFGESRPDLYTPETGGGSAIGNALVSAQEAAASAWQSVKDFTSAQWDKAMAALTPPEEGLPGSGLPDSPNMTPEQELPGIDVVQTPSGLPQNVSELAEQLDSPVVAEQVRNDYVNEIIASKEEGWTPSQQQVETARSIARENVQAARAALDGRNGVEAWADQFLSVSDEQRTLNAAIAQERALAQLNRENFRSDAYLLQPNPQSQPTEQSGITGTQSTPNPQLARRMESIGGIADEAKAAERNYVEAMERAGLVQCKSPCSNIDPQYEPVPGLTDAERQRLAARVASEREAFEKAMSKYSDYEKATEQAFLEERRAAGATETLTAQTRAERAAQMELIGQRETLSVDANDVFTSTAVTEFGSSLVQGESGISKFEITPAAEQRVLAKLYAASDQRALEYESCTNNCGQIAEAMRRTEGYIQQIERGEYTDTGLRSLLVKESNQNPSSFGQSFRETQAALGQAMGDAWAEAGNASTLGGKLSGYAKAAGYFAVSLPGQLTGSALGQTSTDFGLELMTGYGYGGLTGATGYEFLDIVETGSAYAVPLTGVYTFASPVRALENGIGSAFSAASRGVVNTALPPGSTLGSISGSGFAGNFSALPSVTPSAVPAGAALPSPVTSVTPSVAPSQITPSNIVPVRAANSVPSYVNAIARAIDPSNTPSAASAPVAPVLRSAANDVARASSDIGSDVSSAGRLANVFSGTPAGASYNEAAQLGRQAVARYSGAEQALRQAVEAPSAPVTATQRLLADLTEAENLRAAAAARLAQADAALAQESLTLLDEMVPQDIPVVTSRTAPFIISDTPLQRSLGSAVAFAPETGVGAAPLPVRSPFQVGPALKQSGDAIADLQNAGTRHGADISITPAQPVTRPASLDYHGLDAEVRGEYIRSSLDNAADGAVEWLNRPVITEAKQLDGAPLSTRERMALRTELEGVLPQANELYEANKLRANSITGFGGHLQNVSRFLAPIDTPAANALKKLYDPNLFPAGRAYDELPLTDKLALAQRIDDVARQYLDIVSGRLPNTAAAASSEIAPLARREISQAQANAMQQLADRNGIPLDNDFITKHWITDDIDSQSSAAKAFRDLAEGSPADQALVRAAANGDVDGLLAEIGNRMGAPQYVQPKPGAVASDGILSRLAKPLRPLVLGLSMILNPISPGSIPGLSALDNAITSVSPAAASEASRRGMNASRQAAFLGKEREIVASFYGNPGDATAGSRITSSGAIYDPDGFSIAHRDLRLGTKVLLDDGVHTPIVARVTNRGPFVAGRDVDLSYQAAKHFESTNKGVTRLKMTVLDNPPDSVAYSFSKGRSDFNDGSVVSRESAQALVAQAQSAPVVQPTRIAEAAPVEPAVVVTPDEIINRSLTADHPTRAPVGTPQLEAINPLNEVDDFFGRIFTPTEQGVKDVVNQVTKQNPYIARTKLAAQVLKEQPSAADTAAYKKLRDNVARELAGRRDGQGGVSAAEAARADAEIGRQLAVLNGEAQPVRTIGEIAKATGRPEIPGLEGKVHFLHPLQEPASVPKRVALIMHQSEGVNAAGAAQGQAARPSKKGTTIWVERDGTAYWAAPESVSPGHIREGAGPRGLRGDNAYIDNSQTQTVLNSRNTIGIEFVGNPPANLKRGTPNLLKRPLTPEQLKTAAVLGRFIQERYGIPSEKVYAHSWIQSKAESSAKESERYVEGAAAANVVRMLGYRPGIDAATDFTSVTDQALVNTALANLPTGGPMDPTVRTALRDLGNGEIVADNAPVPDVAPNQFVETAFNRASPFNALPAQTAEQVVRDFTTPSAFQAASPLNVRPAPVLVSEPAPVVRPTNPTQVAANEPQVVPVSASQPRGFGIIDAVIETPIALGNAVERVRIAASNIFGAGTDPRVFNRQAIANTPSIETVAISEPGTIVRPASEIEIVNPVRNANEVATIPQVSTAISESKPTLPVSVSVAAASNKARTPTPFEVAVRDVGEPTVRVPEEQIASAPDVPAASPQREALVVAEASLEKSQGEVVRAVNGLAAKQKEMVRAAKVGGLEGLEISKNTVKGIKSDVDALASSADELANNPLLSPTERRALAQSAASARRNAQSLLNEIDDFSRRSYVGMYMAADKFKVSVKAKGAATKQSVSDIKSISEKAGRSEVLSGVNGEVPEVVAVTDAVLIDALSSIDTIVMQAADFDLPSSRGPFEVAVARATPTTSSGPAVPTPIDLPGQEPGVPSGRTPTIAREEEIDPALNPPPIPRQDPVLPFPENTGALPEGEISPTLTADGGPSAAQSQTVSPYARLRNWVSEKVADYRTNRIAAGTGPTEELAPMTDSIAQRMSSLNGPEVPRTERAAGLNEVVDALTARRDLAIRNASEIRASMTDPQVPVTEGVRDVALLRAAEDMDAAAARFGESTDDFVRAREAFARNTPEGDAEANVLAQSGLKKLEEGRAPEARSLSLVRAAEIPAADDMIGRLNQWGSTHGGASADAGNGAGGADNGGTGGGTGGAESAAGESRWKAVLKSAALWCAQGKWRTGACVVLGISGAGNAINTYQNSMEPAPEGQTLGTIRPDMTKGIVFAPDATQQTPGGEGQPAAQPAGDGTQTADGQGAPAASDGSGPGSDSGSGSGAPRDNGVVIGGGPRAYGGYGPAGSSGGGFFGGGMNMISGLFQGLMQWFGGGGEEEEKPQQRPTTPARQEPPVGAIVGNPQVVNAGDTTTLSWSTVGTDTSSSTCAIVTADFSVFARGGQNGSITSGALSESTRFGLVCNVKGAQDKLLNETLIRVRGDESDPPRIFSEEQIAASQASSANPVRPSAQGSGTGGGGSNDGSDGSPTPQDVRTCDPEQAMDSFIRCLCEAEPNPRGCSVPPGGTR